MGYRWPEPDNEHEFELVCLRFYRKHWDNECLKLYGKRGESQDGIDIFDPLGKKPIRVVQCKHHEATKTLPPSKIKEEVKNAEKSVLDIDHYVIATTAKRTRNAHDTIVKLNGRKKKKFTVDIYFWDDICQHLSELGMMQADFILSGHINESGAIPTSVDSLVFRSLIEVPNHSDGSFAEIENLLNERQFEIARHELGKLPNAEAAKSLSPHAQYMLFRLRAKLALETGEFEIASELFLEAYTVTPDLDQAKQNHVLAFSLVGDFAKAYKLAKHYIAEGLTSLVMVLRLIDSTSSLEQIDEHTVVIETHAGTSEDINTALSHKYLQLGDYAKATDAAERALEINQDSPHANFAAALSAHNYCLLGEMKERVHTLQVALKHYDAAESLARKQNFMGLLPEILVNRAAAKMLLGDKSGAETDYRSSVETANKPAEFAACAVAFFLQEEDYDSAWELFDFLDHTTLAGRFLSIATEYNQGDAEEKRAYINEMSSLAEKNWDRAVECRFHCVQWAIELKEYELAESCVPLSFQKKHPLQSKILRAWIFLESKDIQRAKEESDRAQEESLRSAHTQELRLLAEILVKLKDDENAIGILEQIATPGVLNDDMKSLISCAQRLDRHDLLIRICRELRESDINEEQLFKLEVELLNEYLPEEAITVAKELIGKSSSPSYFVAFKNMIAARLDMMDEMDLEMSSLPLPAQLLPSEFQLIMFPYMKMGMYDEALKFLYAQRRLYFEDEGVHGRYIHFFLMNSQKTNLREKPTVVVEDCAVLLESNVGEKRWVTIENECPVATRGEFATNNELSQRILRSKVGDVVELHAAFVQIETATVLEIQTKYVRAFQDSIQNFQKNFPNSSVFQEFHVGEGEKFDASVIVESLQNRREHVEKCLELYISQPCSLHLFSDRVGITEFEAVKALARHPKGIMKCCQISPQEFEQEVQSGIVSNKIVLSVTAIITLTLLDGWKFLDSSKQYLVSQLTSELVDEWIHKSGETKTQESSSFNLNDEDQLVLTDTANDERLSLLEELRTMKQSVEKYCERSSSVSLAELDSEKRKLYRQAMGMHNVEAMSLARDQGATLWSDDFVIGLIGKMEFGVTCVWTQLAMRCFVESGQLSMSEFDLLTAKLASWDYTTIIWTHSTIISAGEDADWNPKEWPFMQCLALIEKSEVHISVKVSIVVKFLKQFRSSSCIELKQSAVIQSILDTLNDARAVRLLMQRVDQIFPVDPFSAKFILAELQFWLSLR